MFWYVLYNAVIVPVGWILFKFLGLFNAKVRRGIKGRKHLFDKLRQEVSKLNPKRKRIWFHSSSMGEFEQAKPIIARLKQQHPDVDVIVSFFSPSGYEHSKNYKLASLITYLPFDSSGNAKVFVNIIKPSAAVMIRYDVWPNHLWALRSAGVPTFIANATLGNNAVRNLPLIKQFHQSMYNALDYILTVSESDKKAFEKFEVKQPVLEIVGDTRYDQVWQRSAESKNRHLLSDKVLSGKKVIVVGSSWEEDENHLLPAFYSLAKQDEQLLMILVPHEPTVENLERIESEMNGYASSIRFSNLQDYGNQKVIIIDSVGILMPLYQYAHVAYVGGSFRQGIHNVLEPAAYGLPVIMGPKYDNSHEAKRMVLNGSAFVGEDVAAIAGHLHTLLYNDKQREEAGSLSLTLVRENVGATERVLSYLEKVL